MILLLGGTSETGSLAGNLAKAGYKVLVSTATDIPFDLGDHPNISRRMGPLDEDRMVKLINEFGIKAIVDVTHPYASLVRTLARRVATRMNISYLTLIRPPSIHEKEGILFAINHEEAAPIACSQSRPVFLTTGSKNLKPYVRESRRADVPLVVRVLPHARSIEACHAVGIPEEFIITGRGPFSAEENRAVIRRFGIGVLVTKDSGAAGGVPDKLEAARLEGCLVVVVQRPNQPSHGAFNNLSDLVTAVSMKTPNSPPK